MKSWICIVKGCDPSPWKWKDTGGCCYTRWRECQRCGRIIVSAWEHKAKRDAQASHLVQQEDDGDHEA